MRSLLFLVVLAPTEGLDVWYAESATAPKTPRVYWKVRFVLFFPPS